jgi:hypothetical protein
LAFGSRLFPPDDSNPQDLKKSVGDIESDIGPRPVQEFIQRRLVNVCIDGELINAQAALSGCVSDKVR